MDSHNTIGLHAAWLIPALSAIAFLLIIFSMRVARGFFANDKRLALIAPIISITAILVG